MAALIELSPDDAARVEQAVAQMITEAAGDRGAFYERSARSLQRVGTRLANWNTDGRHDAVIARLKAQLDGVCVKLDAADAQRSTCEGVLKKAAKANA